MSVMDTFCLNILLEQHNLPSPLPHLNHFSWSNLQALLGKKTEIMTDARNEKKNNLKKKRRHHLLPFTKETCWSVNELHSEKDLWSWHKAFLGIMHVSFKCVSMHFSLPNPQSRHNLPKSLASVGERGWEQLLMSFPSHVSEKKNKAWLYLSFVPTLMDCKAECSPPSSVPGLHSCCCPLHHVLQPLDLLHSMQRHQMQRPAYDTLQLNR